MQTVAAEIGLDLSKHRAVQVDPDGIAKMSLVYAMEPPQVDWLRSQPIGAPTGLLGKATIDDPYGSDLAEYRRVGEEIVAAVRIRLPEIIALAN
jgi:protein-tyrosine-phosphatase